MRKWNLDKSDNKNITEDATVQNLAVIDDSKKIIIVDSSVEGEVAATSDV